jgi:lysophospholipase L1-like esterase
MSRSVQRKAFLGNVAVLLGATVVTLLVTEFAFRLILGHTIVLFPRNHAAAQYGQFTLRSMTPETVFWHQSVDGRWRFKINNKGFRDDKDYIYEKPTDTLRVLLLGDSHTAGFEVDQDQTYASVLEKSLRQRGIRAEVLNTGISGFGTAEELAYLENEGVRYSPDVVVVAFFANDYSDNVRAGLYRLLDGHLSLASQRYVPAVDILRMTLAIPGLKWLGENSYAYSYVFNAVWGLFKARSIQQAATEQAGPEVAVPAGEVTAGAEALTVALLERIAEVGQRMGAYTILVDIPVKDGPSGIGSSFTPAVRDVGTKAFSHVLESDEFLAGRPAGQPAHVAHGHHHINADAHRRLGEALAQILMRSTGAPGHLRKADGGSPSR